MLTFLLRVRSKSGFLFWILGNVCRCGCVFFLCVITVYKVTELPGLDILLAMVFIQSDFEQFKGLSCCVPLGRPVYPSDLVRVYFFSALICAAVWQANGAQHQTALCDLQSDLIQQLIFVRQCYADSMFE